MPRRRMIDPSIWDDPEVGELTPTEFKLFIGLISLADDEGRLEADARTLRKQLFGYCEDVSVQDVGMWLASVSEKLPNVCLYDVEDKSYVALLKWNTHQAISKTWKQDSTIPPPPGEHMPTTCQALEEQVPSTCQEHSEYIPSTFQASAEHIPSTCPPIESIESKPTEEKETESTTESTESSAVSAFLTEIGINEPARSQITGDSRNDVQYLRALWRDSGQKAGLFVHLVRGRAEPARASPEPGSQEDRYRYVRGKYADCINVGKLCEEGA